MRFTFALLALLGLTLNSFGALIDYRALGTNAFFTNNGIVNSKHWTNAPVGIATVIRPVDTARTIFNENSGPNYQGLSVSLFNTGADTFTIGGYLFNSSTNSAAKGAYYFDGAYGGIFEVAPTGLGAIKNGDGIGALGVADGFWSKQIGVAGTALSEANNQTNIGVHASALSAGNTGNTRVGLYAETGTQTQGAVTDFLMVPAVIYGNARSALDPLLILATNGTARFTINADGDPVIPNAAAADKVLVSVDGTGLAKWTNIAAIVTNNQILPASIGPGTVNFMAKFANPTNVMDSRIMEVATNEWWWGVRTNLGAITNETGLTNRFFGERTSAANYHSQILVAQPPAQNRYDELRPDRGSGDARAMNKFRLWGSWDVNGFGTNTVEGLGHWLPFIDYAAGVGLDIGNGSKRIRDLFAGRSLIVAPLSSVAQFTAASGGSSAGVGFTTDGTMVQFFRDTGITAAFNKHPISGALLLDLAGNGLGFGSGISNVHAGFVNSAIIGLVQVGVTNSGSVTPTAQGLMAAQATGADRSGSDFRIVGGPSTGLGTNGSVRIQTSEPALSTSSSLNTGFYDRLYVAAKPKVLVTNTASTVLNISIPTADRMIGGEVSATTKISDGIDQASVREKFAFTAIRKGSTVTTSISASSPMATLATGTATITTTWTAVANSQSVDIKCAVVTGGINSTNTFTRWRLELDSDAVPVIAP